MCNVCIFIQNKVANKIAVGGLCWAVFPVLEGKVKVLAPGTGMVALRSGRVHTSPQCAGKQEKPKDTDK